MPLVSLDDSHGTIIWEEKPLQVFLALLKNSVFINGNHYVPMDIVEKEFRKNFTKVTFQ